MAKYILAPPTSKILSPLLSLPGFPAGLSGKTCLMETPVDLLIAVLPPGVY